MDASTQEFLIRVVWLVIGLGLGYGAGAARTSLRIQKEMACDVHKCMMIMEKYDRKEGHDDSTEA